MKYRFRRADGLYSLFVTKSGYRAQSGHARSIASMPENTIVVKIKGECVPRYQSAHASGCDLYACVDEPCVLQPGQFCAISTGIHIEIPEGYEAQVRPRSGLALREGIGILNAPGTIDADYRGEVKVILFNFGKRPFTIARGDRIAQLVFAQVARATFVRTGALRKTKRGHGGFGHTGK